MRDAGLPFEGITDCVQRRPTDCVHQHQLCTYGLDLLMIVTGLPFGTDSQANNSVKARKQQQRQSMQTTVCVHQQQLCHHSLALLMIVTGLPFGADSQVNHIVGENNSIKAREQ